MVIEYIGESFIIWFQILAYPFLHFELLWRMIPIYLNGLLVSLFSRSADHTSAIFGGFVAIWAGADWIRSFIESNQPVTELNWIVAGCFCAYGFLSLLVGFLKKHSLYKVFGKRSILTFFAITFYPLQTGYLFGFESRIIFAILIVAVPVILVFELIMGMLGKKFGSQSGYQNYPQSSYPPVAPKRRFFGRKRY